MNFTNKNWRNSYIDYRFRALIFLVLTSPVWGATPPGLAPSGLEAYREYESAPNNKAFAISPGGGWGWESAASSIDSAEEKALLACQAGTRQKCVPFAINERIVFDAKSWPGLWGPYAKAKDATKADVGREPAQRFYDIAFRNPEGKSSKLSSLRGKVVVVHFWGSWCAPCRKEMPELESLYKDMRVQKDVAFVLLQMREPYAVSSKWANAQRLSLPLSDSGSNGEMDAKLLLANGSTMADREIARSFPSTFVLDKHGIVIFSHTGPVAGWSQYAAFFNDAVNRSGK